MLYLQDKDIKNLQPSWKASLSIIQDAVMAWSNNDCSQPIKPYLRYGNPENRIIAMPAFLGGPFRIAGIKWIASFPSNLKRNIPRAHSLTVLNDAETGKPVAIINSSLISGLRTASVSGLVIRSFLQFLGNQSLTIGFSGFGPIGQLHFSMIEELVGKQVNEVIVFDISNDIRQKFNSLQKVRFVESWQEAYCDADIFITCTTSSSPYIDINPKAGSLHLNVSLRDYLPEVINSCPHVIVDDWEEVCRENTDIERTHKKYGLKKDDVWSLDFLIKNNYFLKLSKIKFLKEEFAIFNPMGMGIFDIALAKYFYDKSLKEKVGVQLDV